MNTAEKIIDAINTRSLNSGDFLNKGSEKSDIASEIASRTKQCFFRMNITSLRDILKHLHFLPIPIRNNVIIAIADIGAKSAIPALVKEIVDKSECLTCASVALSSLLDDNRAKRILTLFMRTTDSVARIALMKAVMLARLNDDARHTLLLVALNVASDISIDPALRSECIEAIALNSGRLRRRTKQWKEIESMLLALLDDPMAEVRASACYAIGLLRIIGGIASLQMLAKTDHTPIFGDENMTVATEASQALEYL